MFLLEQCTFKWYPRFPQSAGMSLRYDGFREFFRSPGVVFSKVEKKTVILRAACSLRCVFVVYRCPVPAVDIPKGLVEFCCNNTYFTGDPPVTEMTILLTV